jgi:hypothetical protein
MAKTKVATRKKGSKRRNASTKVKRKSAARRVTTKKVKLRFGVPAELLASP